MSETAKTGCAARAAPYVLRRGLQTSTPPQIGARHSALERASQAGGTMEGGRLSGTGAPPRVKMMQVESAARIIIAS